MAVFESLKSRSYLGQSFCTVSVAKADLHPCKIVAELKENAQYVQEKEFLGKCMHVGLQCLVVKGVSTCLSAPSIVCLTSTSKCSIRITAEHACMHQMSRMDADF